MQHRVARDTGCAFLNLYAAMGGEGIQKLSEAIPLRDWSFAQSGPDLVITAYVDRDHRTDR